MGPPPADVTISYSNGANETRSDGSVAWRNNNPGDLIPGSFSTRHGAIGTGAQGFAIFPNRATGDAASYSLLVSPTYINDTLAQRINAWTQTDQQSYLNYVSSTTGVSPDTPLYLLSPQALAAINTAISNFENVTPGNVTCTRRQ